MIPRSLRADPRVVLDAGVRPIRLPWASVRAVQAPGEGGIAVVVPKKAAKLAVDRHRAKRRVGAALLATRVPGYLVVVTLMAPGTRVRGPRLRAWCSELWERILDSTHA
jgi:RNase P protein component